MKKILSILLSAVIVLNIAFSSFSAYAAELSDATFSISGTSFNYTGTEIKPTVSFTITEFDSTLNQDVDVQLVEGTDYTVEYIDNIAVGVGRVIVHGIGSYAGSQDYISSFNIKPAKSATPKISSTTTTSVSLSWTAQPADAGITGYYVYTCDAAGANKKKVATVSTNKATVSKLSVGTKYNFVVCAYKKLANGSTLIGPVSNKVACSTKPNKGIIKQVTNSKDKKTITVKWEKKNCSGYEIKYATKNDFSNAKSFKITNASITSKGFKLNAKTKYYFKIRSYVEYESGKYNYGAWSETSSNSFNKTYSTYSSKYVNNKDRTTNLKVASKAINGTILQPGETFSFNKVVGKRTKAKGYKDAYIFTGSTSHTLGTGGGVCQVASTMFNAALLGNFQIIERHQHSQRVAYVPLGRDAAIYWGSEDFKFKNNTSRPIKINMSVSNGKITCTIKVCEDVSPKKVSLNVSRKGNNFTLKRSVGGKVNYTTKSRY